MYQHVLSIHPVHPWPTLFTFCRCGKLYKSTAQLSRQLSPQTSAAGWFGALIPLKVTEEIEGCRVTEEQFELHLISLEKRNQEPFFQVALCLKQSGRFSLRNMLPFAAKIGGPHFKTWPFEPWISPFSGILELEAARIRTLHGAICNFLDLGSLQKVRSILEPAFVQY